MDVVAARDKHVTDGVAAHVLQAPGDPANMGSHEDGKAGSDL
jgi:hypothetical protein